MARAKFIGAIKENSPAFGLNVTDAAIDRLAEYYELIQEHNSILHLVGPCTPEEFAVRHILESLTLLPHLPPNSRFADVGAGAGLPSIPCLIIRDDLHATLIESKDKKARFLNAAILELGLADRAGVVNRQFEETSPGDAQFVTCRALDKFVEKLPRLIKWGKGQDLLLFGGEKLQGALARQDVAFVQKLMPLSEQRYLYIAPARRTSS
jgi:16S rRNA (guanine(527)-N(7))-methyltransferase RsmG